MAELEAIIERRLIDQLCSGESQWTYRPDIRNEEQLWKNFKYILEQNNKAKLNDTPLSESEFAKVKNDLSHASFYDAGKWLVGENGKVYVHVQRGNETLHLVVMNNEHIAGGTSVYEVINQYQAFKTEENDERDRRFDVTLLINGIPMIHIELKNKEHSYMDGYRQIKKYIAEGKFRGLFSNIQMFVVSNVVDTKYFSAARDTELNKKFITGWIDEKNYPVCDYMDFASGRNRYIGHLISIPSRDFKGIKVGLDCANGSSSAIAKSVFEALQAKTYVINNQPDGTNINTNCGSTHIEVLQKYVVDNGLDIGFAYDGDADRCIAVDHKGNVVDGDKIMYVCGKYLKEQGRLKDDTVVTTVMSNLGLYKSLEREGMKYEQTAVGDKYVAENMMENGYSLGGEQSGHIIFSRYAATGDGILTSLMVMEACVEKKATLCDLAREMKVYPQLLRNVRVADKKIARENPKVVAAVEEVAKKLGSDGRILVRESGTEPLIRVMVEAGTDELCLENVDHVVKVMESEGLLID